MGSKSGLTEAMTRMDLLNGMYLSCRRVRARARVGGRVGVRVGARGGVGVG